MLFHILYRVGSMNDLISISRLQRAFQSVITRHSILRTALYLDTNGTIIQHCLDVNAVTAVTKSDEFWVINLHDKDSEESEVVQKILNQSDLFNLSEWTCY